MTLTIVRATSLSFIAALAFALISLVQASAMSQSMVRVVIVLFALSVTYIHRAIRSAAYRLLADFAGAFSHNVSMGIVLGSSVFAGILLVTGTLLGLS